MQNECSRNRGKRYEENIGRKHVTFILSLNGKVEWLLELMMLLLELRMMKM